MDRRVRSSLSLGCTLEPHGKRGPREHDHALFYVHAKETLSTTYDRDPDDPRVGHAFVLEVDDYGTALKTAALVYPRRVATPHACPSG